MTPYEADKRISHANDPDFTTTNPYLMTERNDKAPNYFSREKLNEVIKDNLTKFATKSIMIHKKNKKVHEYNIGDLVLVIDLRYVDSNIKRTSTKFMQANKRYPWIAKIVAINGRETRITYDIQYLKEHSPTLETAKYAPSTTKLSSTYFKPFFGNIQDNLVFSDQTCVEEKEQNPLDINVSMLLDTENISNNDLSNKDDEPVNDVMIDDPGINDEIVEHHNTSPIEHETSMDKNLNNEDKDEDEDELQKKSKKRKK